MNPLQQPEALSKKRKTKNDALQSAYGKKPREYSLPLYG